MCGNATYKQFEAEVEKFRAWAEQLSEADRLGEWECDYPDWDRIYETWRGLLKHTPLEEWSKHMVDVFLYALARDNENRWMVSDIKRHSPDAILIATKWAIEWGEAEAQYQCAEALGSSSQLGLAEDLLLALAASADEYVRRMALGALCRLGSSHTERIALDLWQKAPPDCPWARMMALSALSEVGSITLKTLLNEAESSEQSELAEFARKLRESQKTVSSEPAG